MKKINKLFLALSCFLPLYIIFGFKNAYKIYIIRKEILSANNDLVTNLISNMHYNCGLLILWIVLIAFSACGLSWFKKKFLDTKDLAYRNIIVLSAQNITAEYFFTYFSVFALSFFTTNITEIGEYINLIVLLAILILMVWVYLINDMYFINPILNLIGYKSYSIKYKRFDNSTDSPNIFEIKVFSKEKLERQVGKNHELIISKYDFSICHKF